MRTKKTLVIKRNLLTPFKNIAIFVVREYRIHLVKQVIFCSDECRDEGIERALQNEKTTKKTWYENNKTDSYESCMTSALKSRTKYSRDIQVTPLLS
jgi:hypothetical protein